MIISAGTKDNGFNKNRSTFFISFTLPFLFGIISSISKYHKAKYEKLLDQIVYNSSFYAKLDIKRKKVLLIMHEHRGYEKMKTIILAGGFGTRISEESHLKPKPMIEIGGMPMLWHIMKIYSHYGFNDFVVCLGYKQYMVKEFFADLLHDSPIIFLPSFMAVAVATPSLCISC